MICHSSYDDFQIDRSSYYDSRSKLELYQSGWKQLADLEHLGRQLADFLGIPMVLEIDRNNH